MATDRSNGDVRTGGDTALMLATQLGRNDIARLLLDRGASVGKPDHAGQTPLMVAAMRGNVALTRILLERGADTAPKDSRGKSAADYAFEEG